MENCSFANNQTDNSSLCLDTLLLNALKNIRTSSEIVETVYYFVGSIGVIGNFIIIFVICNYQKMKENLHDLIILNQSVIDFLSAIALILLTATTKTAQQWDMSGWFGQVICRIWYTSYPLWSLFFISTINLIFLTIERYLEVVHSLWHKVHVTKPRVKIILGVIWFMNIYQLTIHASTTIVEDGECKPMVSWSSDNAKIIYGHINVTLRCYIPIGIMLFCYPAMTWKLWKQEKQIGPMSNIKNKNLAKARRNIVKTLILVSLAYISCWVLNQILYLKFLHGFDLDFSGILYNTSVILILINCCINPVIYSCQYKMFQKGAVYIFKKWFYPNRQILPSELTRSQNPGSRRDDQALQV